MFTRELVPKLYIFVITDCRVKFRFLSHFPADVHILLQLFSTVPVVLFLQVYSLNVCAK